MRVDELAKELGVGWKDIQSVAKVMGVEIGHHANALEDEDVATIKKQFKKPKKVRVEKEADHVVHPGETTREAGEQELVDRAISGPSLNHRVPEIGPLERARQIVDEIKTLHGNKRRWNALSRFERTALLAALRFGQEILNEQEEGVEVSFARWLGVSTATGGKVGSSV